MVLRLKGKQIEAFSIDVFLLILYVFIVAIGG